MEIKIVETYFWIHLISVLITLAFLGYDIGKEKVDSSTAGEAFLLALICGPLFTVIVLGAILGEKHK